MACRMQQHAAVLHDGGAGISPSQPLVATAYLLPAVMRER